MQSVPPSPTADAHEPPITFLVPGFLDSLKTLESLAKYLRRRGHRPMICSPQPSDGSAPLEELADQLAAFIDKAAPGDEPINLFGFSMGGLITRLYLQRFNQYHRVQRYVTVAAPHRGTQTAHVFATLPGIQQMKPGSPLLRQLEEDLDKLKTVYFVSIWTPLDLTIIPADSSELPVGISRRILSPAHGLLMYDPRVQHAVSLALRR